MRILNRFLLLVWFLKWSANGNETSKIKSQWFKGFAIMSANLPALGSDDCADHKHPVSIY